MATEKEAIKTQIKALIPGTKEHKARSSGDPAYHLGNVGSHDHVIHTGYGITGKLHPKTAKAREAKDTTKASLAKHMHGPHSHGAGSAPGSSTPSIGQNSNAVNRAVEKPAVQ